MQLYQGTFLSCISMVFAQVRFPADKGFIEDAFTLASIGDSGVPNDIAPQPRFLQGMFDSLDVFGIFKCTRCHRDQKAAHECCQSQKSPKCCQYLQPVGPPVHFGYGGSLHPGAGFPPLGPFPPGHSGTSFGGFPSGGGGFSSSSFNVKPGACPKKGLFGFLGFRSAGGDELILSDPQQELAFSESDRGLLSREDGYVQGKTEPNPRLFGMFCKDRCFSDLDCPGSLKCCGEKCRECMNPGSISGFF